MTLEERILLTVRSFFNYGDGRDEELVEIFAELVRTEVGKAFDAGFNCATYRVFKKEDVYDNIKEEYLNELK